jgi:hypothetical protein
LSLALPDMTGKMALGLCLSGSCPQEPWLPESRQGGDGVIPVTSWGLSWPEPGQVAVSTFAPLLPSWIWAVRSPLPVGGESRIQRLWRALFAFQLGKLRPSRAEGIANAWSVVTEWRQAPIPQISTQRGLHPIKSVSPRLTPSACLLNQSGGDSAILALIPLKPRRF